MVENTVFYRKGHKCKPALGFCTITTLFLSAVKGPLAKSNL